MSNINFGRGYVYSIQYHIVWCVKYRRKILIDDIEKTLKELLIEISNENNIKIIEMETDLDHIHILIECSPQHFIPNILKIFKGISARKLFLKHPEIKISYGMDTYGTLVILLQLFQKMLKNK